MDREILSVKTRKDLYDFVRKNPGFHLRELSRALNLAITLPDYHLRFLEKHELITSAMAVASGARSACYAISGDAQELRRDPFDELLVRRREGVQLVRGDVDLRDRGAVSEDRHDHCRPRVDEALQVPRVVVHIRHDDRRL